MDRSRAVRFTLSLPASEASSRAPSPAPERTTLSKINHDQNHATHDYDDLKAKLKDLDDDATPGRQGADVYDKNLAWWRAWLRRKLVRTVQWESEIIAKMQVSGH